MLRNLEVEVLVIKSGKTLVKEVSKSNSQMDINEKPRRKIKHREAILTQKYRPKGIKEICVTLISPGEDIIYIGRNKFLRSLLWTRTMCNL